MRAATTYYFYRFSDRLGLCFASLRYYDYDEDKITILFTSLVNIVHLKNKTNLNNIIYTLLHEGIVL